MVAVAHRAGLHAGRVASRPPARTARRRTSPRRAASGGRYSLLQLLGAGQHAPAASPACSPPGSARRRRRPGPPPRSRCTVPARRRPAPPYSSGTCTACRSAATSASRASCGNSPALVRPRRRTARSSPRRATDRLAEHVVLLGGRYRESSMPPNLDVRLRLLPVRYRVAAHPTGGTSKRRVAGDAGEHCAGLGTRARHRAISPHRDRHRLPRRHPRGVHGRARLRGPRPRRRREKIEPAQRR